MQFIRGEHIKCLCDHKDVCEGELPFSEGDVLEVVEVEVDRNWLRAKNARGEEGSISIRYIKKHNNEALIQDETDEYLGHSSQECMDVVSTVQQCTKDAHGQCTKLLCPCLKQDTRSTENTGGNLAFLLLGIDPKTQTLPEHKMESKRHKRIAPPVDNI
ncbi:hypothetical protein CHS0354_041889 [Potamilus streckersoni]|uniref:SH3 domain-containing protein n=1 Tax=Potamilus streckersoni TaxID=2493646 RepID=A0AAE0SSS2_9BIVA|nr:hypothetical protein CHS0354_041889 [Potamilus streckersoni]